MVNPRTEMRELLEITNCGIRLKYIMLSIKHCKEVLNRNGMKLTDEEVKQVRDYLYTLAEIQIEAEQQLKEEALKQEAEGKKSDILK